MDLFCGLFGLYGKDERTEIEKEFDGKYKKIGGTDSETWYEMTRDNSNLSPIQNISSSEVDSLYANVNVRLIRDEIIKDLQGFAKNSLSSSVLQREETFIPGKHIFIKPFIIHKKNFIHVKWIYVSNQ